MNLFCTLFLLGVCGLCYAQPPVIQSPLQKRLRAEAVRWAPMESAKATPQLLSMLDDPAFRSEIANLSIAHLPANELLLLYREGLRLSPIEHNMDATLLLDRNETYVLTDWDQRNLTGMAGGSLQLEEYMETSVLNYPPFSRYTCELKDCQQRPVYFALNNRMISSTAEFGDTGLVLRSSYARGFTAVLPMDTGTYALACMPDGHGKIPVNCSAWHFSVGTFEALDHVVLANLYTWNIFPELPAYKNLGAQFRHMFSPLDEETAVLDGELNTFNEVWTVGNVLFEGGVRYIIPNFAKFFGRERGTALQQWAVKRGIGVVWGSTNVLQNTSATRFLDPTISFVENATASDAAIRSFEDRWQYVKMASRPEGDGQFYVQQWDKLWQEVPRNMRVRNLHPGMCADTDACFAVDQDAHCLCE